MYPDQVSPSKSDYYAKEAIANQAQTGSTLGATPARPGSSAFHDAHQQADRAAQQHAEATAAIDFFTKHPQFDTFVSLVRSGAIKF